jgi:hypothetical protein
MNQHQRTHIRTRITLLRSIMERGRNHNTIRLSTHDIKALSESVDLNEKELNGGE